MSANNRQLPHSIEAEEYLLSCCLLDGADVISRCLEARVRPESFYVAAHGIIFECLLDLYNRQQPIDVSVVAEDLKTAKQLDAIGGYAFLTQVTSRIPTTAQAGYFIETVRDYAVRREAIRAASETVEQACDTTQSAAEIVASLRSKVERIEARTRPNAKRGFTVWAPADFENYTPPPDDVILAEGASNYWRECETALLLGPGGVGKSRLALGLAIADIIKGGFVGFQLTGAVRRWLFVGNENGARRFKDELPRMMRDLTDEQRRTVNDNLRIVALVDDSADSLALDDPEALKLWRETAAVHRPAVLVVDPWEAVIPGSDCNDATATRDGIRQLRALFGPHSERFTLFVLHHAREGAEAARQAEGWNAGAFAKGSKTLRAMARFAINVAPEDPEDGARVVLACGKVNNAQRFATRGAIMDAETHLYARNPDFDLEAWRSDIEGRRSQSTVTIAEVVECVREKAPLAGDETTTADIVEKLKDTGATLRTIQRQLAASVQSGYLRKGKTRGKWRLGSKPLPR